MSKQSTAYHSEHANARRISKAPIERYEVSVTPVRALLPRDVRAEAVAVGRSTAPQGSD